MGKQKLLSGDPLYAQHSKIVQDKQQRVPKATAVACMPHICCGSAQQLFSYFHPHLRPGKYKITGQHSLFSIRDPRPHLSLRFTT